MSDALPHHRPKFARRPEARPEQILDAAEQVFGKYGYQAATLDKVAEAAGITKGTIYLYFKTKRLLFIEMMTRRLSAAIEGIRAEISAKEIGSFDAFLKEILPRIRGLITDPAYPSFFRLMIAESGRFPAIAQDFFKGTIFKAISMGKLAYELGSSEGQLKDLNGSIVLRCLIGMHLAFVVTQEIMGAKEYDPLDWDEINKTIETIFRDGIRRESRDE